ncbi:uncharacterized protein LOC133313900 [Gastrolobium bilobum]|uniref:uncharacterized protein LOC133313900 n=1 Tax=Gastrolobium bilobum TaxID=150636 RepID=UPI002AB1F5D0|nr:uncharacterized protein LOC133313900 [Gastrolobium bilobum]
MTSFVGNGTKEPKTFAKDLFTNGPNEKSHIQSFEDTVMVSFVIRPKYYDSMLLGACFAKGIRGKFIRTTIKSRNKIAHLDGPAPAATDPDFAVWDNEDSLIMTWLWNSMTPEVGRHCMFLSSAMEIWETVRSTYSLKQDMAARYELRNKIFTTKQDSLSVTEYYGTLKELWTELDQFQSLKMKCTADATALAKEVENERIFYFLAGLNSEYDPIRVQILGKETFPSLSAVFNTVRGEENRRGVMMNPDKSVMLSSKDGAASKPTDGSAMISTKKDGSTYRSSFPKYSDGVYTLKYNSDGTLERYKARLVAKGYTQTYGIDYEETFAPVAKMNTVRILLSLAAHYNWDINQFDVKNAFLNGELEEEVYMEIPRGFDSVKGENKVCRLKKALYGLKQSPRAWFGRFTKVMMTLGYRQSQGDHTLFFKHSQNGKLTVLLVYVDDIIITGNDFVERQILQTRLASEFEVKDLGKLRYFLGIEVAHSSKGIFISQRKYVLDLLKEAGKLGCKPSNTPIEQNHKMGYEEESPPVDKGQYQRLVGNLVTWRSKKQDVVARSSAEAEFRAMAQGICELLWLKIVLDDLKIKCEGPMKLLCDNKSAICIAHNPVQHDRTKHIEVDRHFIKEKLDSGLITTPYIPTGRQLADLLTKGLPSEYPFSSVSITSSP